MQGHPIPLYALAGMDCPRVRYPQLNDIVEADLADQGYQVLTDAGQQVDKVIQLYEVRLAAFCLSWVYHQQLAESSRQHATQSSIALSHVTVRPACLLTTFLPFAPPAVSDIAVGPLL